MCTNIIVRPIVDRDLGMLSKGLRGYKIVHLPTDLTENLVISKTAISSIEELYKMHELGIVIEYHEAIITDIPTSAFNAYRKNYCAISN